MILAKSRVEESQSSNIE